MVTNKKHNTTEELDRILTKEFLTEHYIKQNLNLTQIGEKPTC